jgi:hypothetical protein
MLFNDRRATQRALKAANGPSLAPKGYKTDSSRRSEVSARANGRMALATRKKAYIYATTRQDEIEKGM